MDTPSKSNTVSKVVLELFTVALYLMGFSMAFTGDAEFVFVGSHWMIAR